MLVILSDLHFTDETTSRDVHGEAFTGVLQNEIIASLNSKAARELQLVLAGDIIDVVRTDFWIMRYVNSPAARNTLPWNGALDPDTAMNKETAVMLAGYKEMIERVCRGRSFLAFCSMLKALCDACAKLSIPFAVTYIIGNHDRVLNNFSALRDQLQNKIEALTQVKIQFSRELYLPTYDTFIRHGHVWDAECHGYEIYTKVLHPGEALDIQSERAHCVQAIGEVITAELMSGIVCRVRERLMADNKLNEKTAFLEAVKDINNVRPMFRLAEWLEWLRQGQMDDYEKTVLMDAARASALAAMNTSLAQVWKQTLSSTSRLALKAAESAIKHEINFDFLVKAVKTFLSFKVGESGKDRYADKASEEAAARGAQYVVYGHTHEAKSVYYSGRQDNKVIFYINSGSYLPCIQPARHSGFAYDLRMTLPFFYLPEEDNRDHNKKPEYDFDTHQTAPRVSLEFWDGLKRKTYVK
jgi:UDP-2,3-diacylglucosamine pyrophosphatase LpxH